MERMSCFDAALLGAGAQEFQDGREKKGLLAAADDDAAGLAVCSAAA